MGDKSGEEDRAERGCTNDDGVRNTGDTRDDEAVDCERDEDCEIAEARTEAAATWRRGT